jgi:hypothetical protein
MANTIFTGQVNITSTAVQLVAARAGRVELRIRLLDNSTPLEIGFVSFVLGAGYVVPIGTEFSLCGYTGAVWGAVNSTLSVAATTFETV